MRNLGEQWVEEIDGKKHMLKAVNYSEGCNGCIFLRYDPDEFYTCNHDRLDCPVYDGMIIKDLGILNNDECLPCPFCGEYPEILKGKLGYKIRHVCRDSYVMAGTGIYATEQQAIDAWNRRM